MAPNEGPGGNRTVWESRPGYSGPAGGGPGGGGGRPPGGGGARPPGGGGPPRGPSPYRGQPDDSDHAAPLPADYLQKDYFDETGTIRKEIVLATAKEVADQISKDRRLVADKREGIKNTAIRAFFSHVRAIEARVDAGRRFEDVRPEIWRLKKMAAYQRQRQQSPVNETFVEFIERNVELAEEDEKHFRAFVEHFESVMAFFPRQERGQR